MNMRFASVGAIGALAPMATAAVTFTFLDPSSISEVTYAPPASGDAPLTGNLEYDPAAMVTLKVDATEEGGGVSFFDTTLTFDVDVAPVDDPGALVIQAPLTGTFEFRETGTNALVLSASFSGGILFDFGGAGALVATSEAMMSSLTYTPGAALTAAEPAITQLIAPADAVFTLTNVRFSGPKTVEVDGEDFLGDFTANAAFTGTAFIPSPGSVAIAAAALLGGLGVRRRRG